MFVAGSLVALFAIPVNAYAMHIGEGILPFDWCALWYGLSMPFVALGLYKLKKDKNVGRKKPLLGMVAAAIFIVSCMPIPVPTAGTCSHPAGTAMAAILIGPMYSILATAVALLLQALFLAHGGITTWGANITSMGIVGSFVGYASLQGAYETQRAAGRCGVLCGAYRRLGRIRDDVV